MNKQIDEILDFCFEGEMSWIEDQLAGTRYYKESMENIDRSKAETKARIQKLIVEEELKEFKRYKYIYPGNVLEPMRSEYFFGELIGQLEEQLKELEK